MTDTQRIADELAKPFPQQALKQRPIGGGKNATYVETETVIRRLNHATGNNWSFNVTRFEWRDDLLIAVGELTIPNMGTRTGTGVQRIAGNADDLVKGAASDALKKAATLFGVGLELYGPDLEAGEMAGPPAQRQQTAQAKPTPMRAEAMPEPREAMRIIRERLAAAELRDMGGIKLDIKQWGLDNEMEILAAYNARNHVLKGTAPATASEQGQQALPTGDEPTPKQMKYLDVIAREAGISEDELEQRVMDAFGVGMSAMTKRHVSTLIEQIQSERVVV